MNSEITVALLSLAGTCIGSVVGILTANKLTNYRIAQLEKKVDEHNGYGKRIPVMEEQIKSINHRLKDLESVEKELVIHKKEVI
ncbi:MAG: hypothetical protein IJD14_06640 [Christensenellaceae bacterium]|nr:hypothetical protein [Christensenellaceae bacterium]